MKQTITLEQYVVENVATKHDILALLQEIVNLKKEILDLKKKLKVDEPKVLRFIQDGKVMVETVLNEKD